VEWSKVKNIILLILLTVNLFLAVLLVYEEGRSAQYLSGARESAIQVLEKNGIAVDGDILPDDLALTAMGASRDRQAERERAQALLGQVTEESQGSSVVYQGPSGQLRVSRSGSEFSAQLEPGAFPLGEKEPAQHATDLLQQLGLEGDVLGVLEEGERISVTVRQKWQHIPVFTCLAVLVYEQGSLVQIQEGGRCLPGTPTQAGDRQAISVDTALLRFLEGIQELGDICSRITQMTPGYLMNSAGFTGSAELVPAWQFRTDSDQGYYLNALTGELSRSD
jgi:hypothetical protein